MKKIKLLFFLVSLFAIFGCEDCECLDEQTNEPIIPISCDLQSTLNLSTGIDVNGDVLEAGQGVVDPFWRVLNNPPLINCNDPLVSTINGNAYAINYNNLGQDTWVNQTGSETLAPLDLGTTNTFGCNNANNPLGEKIPYVFERPFCVLEATSIDFSFTLKGDDEVYFELIDNSNNSIISTSPLYVWSSTAVQTWSANGLSLQSGSYSLRGYLVNTNATILGFSLVGSVATTNGDVSISNNFDGCCENNVISILNILDLDCDGQFNNATDQLGNNWTFNLKDSTNTIIRTEVTDANGNIFFSGLPNGTYTVEIENQTNWSQNSPNNGIYNVTLSNNQVDIVEFYSCTQ